LAGSAAAAFVGAADLPEFESVAAGGAEEAPEGGVVCAFATVALAKQSAAIAATRSARAKTAISLIIPRSPEAPAS
jgi:hypothetical protein